VVLVSVYLHLSNNGKHALVSGGVYKERASSEPPETQKQEKQKKNKNIRQSTKQKQQ